MTSSQIGNLIRSMNITVYQKELINKWNYNELAKLIYILKMDLPVFHDKKLYLKSERSNKNIKFKNWTLENIKTDPHSFYLLWKEFMSVEEQMILQRLKDIKPIVINEISDYWLQLGISHDAPDAFYIQTKYREKYPAYLKAVLFKDSKGDFEIVITDLTMSQATAISTSIPRDGNTDPRYIRRQQYYCSSGNFKQESCGDKCYYRVCN
jgi:hypothetical protein